jgi:hypothetical protein
VAVHAGLVNGRGSVANWGTSASAMSALPSHGSSEITLPSLNPLFENHYLDAWYVMSVVGSCCLGYADDGMKYSHNYLLLPSDLFPSIIKPPNNDLTLSNSTQLL